MTEPPAASTAARTAARDGSVDSALITTCTYLPLVVFAAHFALPPLVRTFRRSLETFSGFAACAAFTPAPNSAMAKRPRGRSIRDSRLTRPVLLVVDSCTAWPLDAMFFLPYERTYKAGCYREAMSETRCLGNGAQHNLWIGGARRTDCGGGTVCVKQFAERVARPGGPEK